MEIMVAEYNEATNEFELVRWVWEVRLEDIMPAEPEYSGAVFAERAQSISVDE